MQHCKGTFSGFGGILVTAVMLVTFNCALLADDKPALQAAAPEALIKAAEVGDIQAFQMQLDLLSMETHSQYQGDLNAPLMAAIKNNKPEMVAHLLKLGAKAEDIRPSGETPLSLAAKLGHSKVVEALIAAGANVNFAEQNRRGRTPLILASIPGHVRVVKILIRAKALRFTKDKEGKTALDHVRNKRGEGYQDVIRLLREGLAE